MTNESAYKFNPDKPEEGNKKVLDISNMGVEYEDTDTEHMKYSKNGKYIAYTTSKNGSDWKKIRVVDIATGKDLPDVIEHVKFSGPSWDDEANGFFYGRFDSSENKQLKYVGSDP